MKKSLLLIASLCSSLWVQPALADTEESACLAEVREEMLRFEVKSLDPKIQQAVAGLCERGDTETAVRLAVPAAAARRCVLQVREAAARVEPTPGKEEVGRAYELCRRGGELDAALAIIGASPGETADPPVEADPPAQTDPPTQADPPAKAVIHRFEARPPTVRRGEASRLTWEVYGTDQVSLDGEAVPAQGGQKLVRPDKTTRYYLEAISGRELIEEMTTVRVSPFARPRLASPIRSIELCREVDTSGGGYRCISSDGPFWAGDPVQVIVRFAEIADGEHHLEYTVSAGVGTDSTKWTLVDRASGPFQHQGNRSKVRDHRQAARAATSFEVPSKGKGTRKIEIVLDRREATRSEILFCVECPGHDEW